MTTLFRAEWGSRSYGTNTPESDNDIIQVLIEPPSAVTGLDDFKALHTSTSGTQNRSRAGDIDVVTYGLKKYASLLVVGNPQVLATLWLSNWEINSVYYQHLRSMRESFISKRAGERYLGYMKSQRHHLTSDDKKSRPRADLVKSFGYDVKFSMHAVRLGYQGIQLMEEGTIDLPMSGKALEICQDIRAGNRTKAQDIELIRTLEDRLASAIDLSDHPRTGDRDKMNKFLFNTYMSEWTGESYAQQTYAGESKLPGS